MFVSWFNKCVKRLGYFDMPSLIMPFCLSIDLPNRVCNPGLPEPGLPVIYFKPETLHGLNRLPTPSFRVWDFYIFSLCCFINVTN